MAIFNSFLYVYQRVLPIFLAQKIFGAETFTDTRCHQPGDTIRIISSDGTWAAGCSFFWRDVSILDKFTHFQNYQDNKQPWIVEDLGFELALP